MNTEERVAPLSPTKSCGDLLSITSSKGGLKAEVATILGAQQFFHESGAPKRSVLCRFQRQDHILLKPVGDDLEF